MCQVCLPRPAPRGRRWGVSLGSFGWILFLASVCAAGGRRQKDGPDRASGLRIRDSPSRSSGARLRLNSSTHPTSLEVGDCEPLEQPPCTTGPRHPVSLGERGDCRVA
jgi:hypothetical protein